MSNEQLERIERKLDRVIEVQSEQSAEIAVLKSKDASRTWFDRVVVGAWIVVIVGGVASVLHIRGQ